MDSFNTDSDISNNFCDIYSNLYNSVRDESISNIQHEICELINDKFSSNKYTS